MQCGYCIPGFIMTSVALLNRAPHPTGEQMREALSQNMCRCGTYQRILRRGRAGGDRRWRTHADATRHEPGCTSSAKSALGFPPPRQTYARVAYGNTEPDADKARWLTVRRGRARSTAYAGKVEYGQGIRTGLAIEVADELRVPLDAVEVVLGDTGRVPWDMGTFGSQSTARVGRAAAQGGGDGAAGAAGAGGRPASTCRRPSLRAANGRIAPASRRRRVRSTTPTLLGGRSIARDIDDAIALTPQSEFTVMGRDAAARRRGRARDGRAPCTRRTSCSTGCCSRRCCGGRARGATLASVDTSVAERMPGVVQVVREDDLVAVLADTDEHAARGAGDAGADVAVAGGRARDTRRRIDLPNILVESGARSVRHAGGGRRSTRASAAAAHVLEATYFVPYVSNAPMEPRAAVAAWDGRPAHRVGGDAAAVRHPHRAGAAVRDRRERRCASSRPRSVAGSAARARTRSRTRRRGWRASPGGRCASRTRAPRTWCTRRCVRPRSSRIKSGFTADGRIVAWECHALPRRRPAVPRPARLGHRRTTRRT